MCGEITSLEFTYSVDAADGRQAVRYTLADISERARPERAEELLDDLRAVAEQLTADDHACTARRRGLSVVTSELSARNLP